MNVWESGWKWFMEKKMLCGVWEDTRQRQTSEYLSDFKSKDISTNSTQTQLVYHCHKRFLSYILGWIIIALDWLYFIITSSPMLTSYKYDRLQKSKVIARHSSRQTVNLTLVVITFQNFNVWVFFSWHLYQKQEEQNGNKIVSKSDVCWTSHGSRYSQGVLLK